MEIQARVHSKRMEEVGCGSPPFTAQMKHHVPGSGHGAFALGGLLDEHQTGFELSDRLDLPTSIFPCRAMAFSRGRTIAKSVSEFVREPLHLPVPPRGARGGWKARVMLVNVGQNAY